MTYKTLIASAVLTCFASVAVADDVARLAGLSKRKFMAEFEELLLKAVGVQQMLLDRFDPDLAEGAISDAPLTDAERDAISCAWDKLDAEDKLKDLARYALAYQYMETVAEERPDLDFVDIMMDSELTEGQAAQVSDEVGIVLSDCGMISASTERVNFPPEFWQRMGQAAAERGYTD